MVDRRDFFNVTHILNPEFFKHQLNVRLTHDSMKEVVNKTAFPFPDEDGSYR